MSRVARRALFDTWGIVNALVALVVVPAAIGVLWRESHIVGGAAAALAISVIVRFAYRGKH